MSDRHEGYRDRLQGGCPDCVAYVEVVTPIGATESSITVFHDPTCPATEDQWISGGEERVVVHKTKPDVLPYWPEQ